MLVQFKFCKKAVHAVLEGITISNNYHYELTKSFGVPKHSIRKACLARHEHLRLKCLEGYCLLQLAGIEVKQK